MFRITKSGVIITHKCTQCGFITQYSTFGISVCTHCKTSQKIQTIGGRNSAPMPFLMDIAPLWRMIYHLQDTKPE